MSDVTTGEAASGDAPVEFWPGKPAYVPIEKSRKLGPIWATILVQIMFLVLAVIASIIALAATLVIWSVAQGDPGALDADTLMTGPGFGWGVAASLLAQFAVWGGMALIWTRGVEKRSYASIGMGGKGWTFRYLRGFLLGIGLALLLATAAGILAEVAGVVPEDAPDLSAIDWSRLAEPQIALPLGMIALLFMFQASAEEVAFRGWMMSSIASRTGALTAILVNSIVFGLFHAHVLLSGFGFGVVAMAGLITTGIFFSVVAWKERSIAGACGLHGGFNVAIIGSGLAIALLLDPETSWSVKFAEVLNASAGIFEEGEVTVTVQTFTQVFVMGGLAILLALFLGRSRRDDG